MEMKNAAQTGTATYVPVQNTPQAQQYPQVQYVQGQVQTQQQTTQNFGNVIPAAQVERIPGVTSPPVGQWKDGLCDCFSNLWPSCG